MAPSGDAAGANTFGAGSGSTSAFTVYSTAQFGQNGSAYDLLIYSPTTLAGTLSVTGTSSFTGAANFTGECSKRPSSLMSPA